MLQLPPDPTGRQGRSKVIPMVTPPTLADFEKGVMTVRRDPYRRERKEMDGWMG